MKKRRLLNTFFRRVRFALKHGFSREEFDYHGVKVHVPLSVPFGVKWLISKGTHEQAERLLIDKYMPIDLPVVELGGSLGLLASYVASKLKPGARYIAVEANPSLAVVCKRNISAAAPGVDLKVVNAAVAYGVETVSFFADEDVLAGRLQGNGAVGNITVEAVTLSDLLAKEGMTGPFVLIVDIESAEKDLFLNDPAALAHVQMLCVEMHPKLFSRGEQDEAELVAVIERAGLRMVEKIADSYAFVRG